MKNIILISISIILTSACSEGSQNSAQATLTKDYRKVSDYKSKEDLESAANANNPEALFVLGSMYARGEGVEFSQKKSFELFEKSAKLGSSNAMLQLGLIYRNGNGLIKKMI